MSVTLIVEDVGHLKFELYCEQVPKTCRNFLALAAAGFYNGTKFHRNIKGFIIQGGDPTNTGKGGESIFGGTFEDEVVADLKHDRRGILAMANSGLNKNLSQFFITYGKHATLDGKFTVFGHLVDGFQTLDLLENEPVDKHNKPLNNLVVSDIEINCNPIAEIDFSYEQERAERAVEKKVDIEISD